MAQTLDSFENKHGYIIFNEGANNTVDIEVSQNDDVAITWKGITYRELIEIAGFIVNVAAELKIRESL